MKIDLWKRQFQTNFLNFYLFKLHILLNNELPIMNFNIELKDIFMEELCLKICIHGLVFSHLKKRDVLFDFSSIFSISLLKQT